MSEMEGKIIFGYDSPDLLPSVTSRPLTEEELQRYLNEGELPQQVSENALRRDSSDDSPKENT